MKMRTDNPEFVMIEKTRISARSFLSNKDGFISPNSQNRL